MSAIITYSEFLLTFDIPEELSAKVEVSDSTPEVVSFVLSGGRGSGRAVLTVKLDGEEYELNTRLYPEEYDALDSITNDGINCDINKIVGIEWGSYCAYVEFGEIRLAVGKAL